MVLILRKKLAHFKENTLDNITCNKIIFYFSWFLCFSIALPHHILPGKAGAISIIVFILWLFNGDIKNKLLVLKHSKLFLYLTAFILTLVISIVWSENTDFGVRRLYAFKYYFLLIPVFITSFYKHESMRLIHAFVLGCILHATLMILQSHNIIYLPNKIDLYSPYSTYSTFFVFSSFYCFYFFHYYSNSNKLKQIIYLSFTLLFIYTLFTNPARSGQLAFIISMIVTIFLLHHNLKKTIIIFSIFTTLIATLVLSSDNVQSTYIAAINEIHQIQKENYTGSWGARWGLSLAAIEVIKNNPIFGVGLGDTHDERRRVIGQKFKGESRKIVYFSGIHNNYLTILEAAGIIGLIFYFLIFVHIYKLPIKNFEFKSLSLIFLTILAVASIADDIIFYKPYNIHFAIMLALFINLSLDDKDTDLKLK